MDGVRIKQLTIHTEQEPLQSQLRVERLLRTMNLQPRGMQEGEFLFIRHLRIDTPLDTRRMLDSEWERLVQETLTQYARQAYRPRMGERVIPTQYESIYFPDAVHLLTCLTEALLYQPDILQGWLLRNALPYQAPSVASALVMLWSTHIRALPAMTRYLSPETLRHALQRLDENALKIVLTELHQAYGLGSALPDLYLKPEAIDRYKTQPTTDFSLLRNAPVASATTMTERYLLTLCHVLQHRPTFAHSPEFQSIMQQHLFESASPTNRSDVHDETQNDSPIHHLTATATHQREEERNPVEASPFTGQPYVTQLGGVFYLLHCLSWLGLPTEAQRPYIGAWGMLEAVARVLLADSVDNFAEDVLWQVLQLLDQRADHETIGTGWHPADSPHIPERWLTYLEQAGYDDAIVYDVHRQQPDDFTQWLAMNRPIILALITHKLGVWFDEFDPLTLLHKPATIYLSNTHIDAVQWIDNIDIRVRRAGWDIDPGWRPDLGYIIYFHFVEG